MFVSANIVGNSEIPSYEIRALRKETKKNIGYLLPNWIKEWITIFYFHDLISMYPVYIVIIYLILVFVYIIS